MYFEYGKFLISITAFIIAVPKILELELVFDDNCTDNCTSPQFYPTELKKNITYRRSYNIIQFLASVVIPIMFLMPLNGCLIVKQVHSSQKVKRYIQLTKNFVNFSYNALWLVKWYIGPKGGKKPIVDWKF